MKPIKRSPVSLHSFDLVRKLRKRHSAGKRYEYYGILSILFALFFMGTLITTIFYHGWTSFIRTEVCLPTSIPQKMEVQTQEVYNSILLEGLYAKLKISQVNEEIELLDLLSANSSHTIHQISKSLIPASQGEVCYTASQAVDKWFKRFKFSKTQPDELIAGMTEQQLQWTQGLQAESALRLRFNKNFFTHGDSQEPEIAGIYSALIGSLLTLGISILIAFPLGIATAVYLEEFAPKGRLFDFLEININNLAAVPTIIFGLLGLAFFLNFLQLPRSASLVGGLTLSLIILPTIVISSRVALQMVPQSIRQAAQGLGASKVQTTIHHIIPLAMPGMLTGTLLGLVRAMGESAPLLMLGMVAFIVETPTSIFDPATVLPVQIFSWAKNPSRGFVENTSAATLVLLLFLFILNTIVIYLRRKFERKW